MIGTKLLDLICPMITDDKEFGPIFAHLQDMSNDDTLNSAYHIENDLLFLREGERMCIPDIPKV